MSFGKWVAAAAVAVVAFGAAPARAQAGKKVLYVNSYHEGYEWSDGEQAGAKKVLSAAGVEAKYVYMDAKRHPEEPFRVQAAEKIRAEIESWKPDAVIVSDDVATKYILQAHFKDAKVPFVFCGVNWDGSKYGLPYKNTTGMYEVSLPKELIDNLKGYAKGARVAYLTVDSETERAELEAIKKVPGVSFAAVRSVKTFAEWKAEFQKLQGEVDILFVGNYAGMVGFVEAEAGVFAAENSKIVSGSTYDFLAPYAMLSLAKVAEEQGAWAAQSALAIVKGAAPSSIPVAKNKQSKIVLNPKLAAKAGVVFKPDILRNATIAAK